MHLLHAKPGALCHALVRLRCHVSRCAQLRPQMTGAVAQQHPTTCLADATRLSMTDTPQSSLLIAWCCVVTRSPAPHYHVTAGEQVS